MRRHESSCLRSTGCFWIFSGRSIGGRARRPIEVAVGAILTQNTSWSNVEKAIANSRRPDAWTPAKLHELDMERARKLIRPAGYFRVKAKRLGISPTWLCDRYDGDMQNLEAIATPACARSC